MKFRYLAIGDKFDFVNPARDFNINSFFDSCVKISARKYRSLVDGREYRVSSINASVFHVEGRAL